MADNHKYPIRKLLRTAILLTAATGVVWVVALAFMLLPLHRHVLTIGTNVWLGYEHLYLGRELGYYDDDQVKFLEYSSASQVLGGFRNGTIDIAAVTLDELLLLRESGIDAVIIALMDYSLGADVLMARPEIKTPADLAGGRIGVETSAVGALMFRRFTELSGLSAGSVRVVPLHIHEHEAAMATEKVDAVVTFHPAAARLKSRGYVQLFSSRQIPGEIIDILVARRGVAQAERQAVARLLQGMYRAEDYARRYPEEAYRHMHARLRLTWPEFQEARSEIQILGAAENITLLLENRASLQQSASKIEAVMMEGGLIQRNADLDRMFDEPLVQYLYQSLKTDFTKRASPEATRPVGAPKT